MAGAVALEAIDPNGRHAAGAGAALVEPYREVEVLGSGPERLVHRVMHHVILVVRVRPEKAALEAQLAAGEAHLLDRQMRVLHRQHRHPE